ncbi:MAG: DUF86 domain-containing protein [Planctomycetes bacterium]|nr:DUF86 domain-containing protein [Planctomycetota bacterium]
MNTRCRKLLQDVCTASALIEQFARGKSREDYGKDALLRSGIERQLLIVGEAMSRLVQEDPLLAAGFGDVKRIVAFRNILVHAYFQINDDVVWDVLQQHLPPLASMARSLLNSP